MSRQTSSRKQLTISIRLSRRINKVRWDRAIGKRQLNLTCTVFKKPPFRIQEKGWGEFDMTIVLTAFHKGGEHTLEHDLNFQSERYEAKHIVVSSYKAYG